MRREKAFRTFITRKCFLLLTHILTQRPDCRVPVAAQVTGLPHPYRSTMASRPASHLQSDTTSCPPRQLTAHFAHVLTLCSSGAEGNRQAALDCPELLFFRCSCLYFQAAVIGQIIPPDRKWRNLSPKYETPSSFHFSGAVHCARAVAICLHP